MKSLSLIVLFLFVISCGKESTMEEARIIQPALPNDSLIEISEPANAPSNVLDHFNAAYERIRFTFSNFDLVMDKLPAHSDPDWVWNAAFGNWTISVVATVLSGDEVTWVVKTIFNDSRPDWVISSGQTDLEGKSGSSWQFYDTFSTTASTTADWYRGDILTVVVEDQESQRYQLVGKPDGDRGLSVSMPNGTTIFTAAWNSVSGSGNWTSYDGSTGLETQNGTW